MRRARLIPLLLLVAEPARLLAQWQATEELGRSYIEQPELPSQGATTAGLTLDFVTPWSFVRSTALGAETSDGRQTGQWLTQASVASPAWKSWMLQGTGAFSAFGQTSLSATTSRDLLIRARNGSLARGFALGGAVGTTIHNETAIPNHRAIADGWFSFKMEQFTADATLTRTRSVFGGSSILVDISRENANYLDLGAGWSHDVGAWSISAGAGMRGRNGTFDPHDRWQSVNGTVWLASHVGVTLDVGRTLEDLTRGVPRTRYLSVGLRAVVQPHIAIVRHERRIEGPRITVARAGDARRIEISNVSAARVELMADFTDWSPVELVAAGTNSWRLERAIPPGPHRVAIRIEGGDWIVPANLPRVDDEFGGTVGLITVP